MRLVVALVLVALPAMATPRAGFASYKNARLLCSEHVIGNTMHITWSSYATKDTVDTVVADYVKTTGRKATSEKDGSKLLVWDDTHHLAVYATADNDKFPHCNQKPKSGERAVILMSNVSK